jgi:hypothetical protein
VNDRIKILLALPVTRKVALALAFAGLVIANKKLGLGLENGDLGMIAAGIVAAILGIAYEDAHKSLPQHPQPPKPNPPPEGP